MNFDQLGQSWRDENGAASPKTQLEQHVKTTRAVERFTGAIFRRDLIESAACLYVIYKFGSMLFDKGFLAAVTLPSVLVFGVVVNALGAIHIIYRLYRARTSTPRPGVDAPMREYVGAELDRVEGQIALLRSVHVWYLGPFYVGVNAMFLSYDGFCAEFVGAVVIVTALYAFIYAMNQLVVSTSMTALRDELAWLRDQLDGEESEPPEPLDQATITKVTLRFVYRWFAILISVAIGVFLFLWWSDQQPEERPDQRSECIRRSPFDAVRWQEDRLEVRLEDEWFYLWGVNGVTPDKLIEFSQANYGDQWRKQIEKDLVEVIARMEREMNGSLVLMISPMDSKLAFESRIIPMTADAKRLHERIAKRREKERSPFDAVRWQDNLPEVRVDEDWYRLVSIDGVTADEIIDFCLWNYRRKSRQRFEEYLVEVMAEMGHEPGKTVRLVVFLIGSDEELTLEDVPMTEEKRSAIYRAAREREKRTNGMESGKAAGSSAK